MFATTTPVALTMSPQSPVMFAVRKLTCEAPLQHCSPIVLVVDDVLMVLDEEVLDGVGAELELVELVDVVGVGADVDDVKLVDVLDVLGTVEPATDVEVVVSPGVDELLVELVLVVVDEPLARGRRGGGASARARAAARGGGRRPSWCSCCGARGSTRATSWSSTTCSSVVSPRDRRRGGVVRILQRRHAQERGLAARAAERMHELLAELVPDGDRARDELALTLRVRRRGSR
jgi:hypothetical protein